MSETDALRGFLGKWEAQWPEWKVAEAFVPASQRERAQAWFALREELAEAAWGEGDARPGDAKAGVALAFMRDLPSQIQFFEPSSSSRSGPKWTSKRSSSASVTGT